MSGMIVLFLAPLRLGLILGTSFGGGSLQLIPDIKSIPLNIAENSFEPCATYFPKNYSISEITVLIVSKQPS